jgi:ribonuclease P protein subunit RPR2
MASNKEKAVIEKRMKELFELTILDEREKDNDIANRKIELIFLYSQKYKVGIPTEARIWFCRKCKKGIYSTGGHIRLKKSMISVHCGNCGYVRRFRITRR